MEISNRFSDMRKRTRHFDLNVLSNMIDVQQSPHTFQISLKMFDQSDKFSEHRSQQSLHNCQILSKRFINHTSSLVQGILI